MNNSPAFQFYPGEWLKDQRIALMTLEEEGAYIRLLSYCWDAGSIPNNSQKVSKLIGKGATQKTSKAVMSMFYAHPADETILVHPLLEKEKIKQVEWRRKCSEGGKNSANKRYPKSKGSSTNPEETFQVKPNTSISTTVKNQSYTPIHDSN